MEFLRVVRRRSVLSEAIYILLNLGLAAAILVFTISTGTPWAAIALVLLSKWRVLAVRPRFWFAHVEANMVDLIVSFSVVALIYLAGQSTASNGGVLVQVFLAVLYAGWLLLLKPRTRRSYVAIQAATAIFIGSFALESLSFEWPSSLVVIVLWIIGYSSARHVLVSHSDSEIRFLSLLWGFVVAEIGWVAYHWTIAYSLPLAGLKLPQATLLLLGISFLGERTYSSYMKHQTIRFNDIVLPALLVVGVIFILMTLFNSATIGGSA